MACGEDAFIARCCVGRIDLDTVDRMAKALVASILRNRATKVKKERSSEPSRQGTREAD